MDGLEVKILQWMIYRGTPMSGNLHIFYSSQSLIQLIPDIPVWDVVFFDQPIN